MEGTFIGMAGRKTAAILFTVTFLITSIFTGCGEKAERIAEIRLDYDSFDFAGVEGLSQISPDAVIPEYCSEVSIGYTQEDGTNKLLLFSQPVQYMNSSGSLEPIDTRIKNADPSEERKGYIYQTASCDINVYYPEHLSQGSGIKLCSEKYEYELRLKNNKKLFSQYETIYDFLGDERMGVSYGGAFGKDTCMQSYPSSLGARNEIILQRPVGETKFIFELKAEDATPRVEAGGYILLISNEKDEEGKEIILGVIHPPLLKDANQNLSVDNSLRITGAGENLYDVEVVLDPAFLSSDTTKYPLMFDLCTEMRKEKQADTQVYSKQPDLNAYLRNYTIIGDHPDYGESECYVRYQFIREYGIPADRITSAEYITYSLTDQKQSISAFFVLEDWCSLTSNWNHKAPYGEQIGGLDASAGEIHLDISKAAQAFAKDTSGAMQSNGMLLRSGQKGGFSVLASSDSSLFNVRTEIIFR